MFFKRAKTKVQRPKSKSFMPFPKSRTRFVLVLMAGIILLAGLFAVALTILAPDAASARGTLLLTVFIIILVVTLLSIILLLRWMLRPYRQLVGEAERAPVSVRSEKPRDEGQFVLETFKSVVAQLQARERELEALSAQASARAASAEKFSERIVASVPSGLIAFDGQGKATVVNAPARALIEADGDAAEGQSVRELLRAAPDLAEMVERCLQTGEVYRREEVVATATNGQLRRLGATVAPIDPEPSKGARGALCHKTECPARALRWLWINWSDGCTKSAKLTVRCGCYDLFAAIDLSGLQATLNHLCQIGRGSEQLAHALAFCGVAVRLNERARRRIDHSSLALRIEGYEAGRHTRNDSL